MKRILAATFAGAALFSAVAAGPQSAAAADVDHELALAIGEDGTVAGGVAQGVNPDYHGVAGTPVSGQCNHDPVSYCETILVQLTNPFEEENAKKGRERANLNVVLTPTNPVSDFDFKMFESDETGARGSELATAGASPIVDDPNSAEYATAVITTTEDVTTVWVLIEVAYFAAPSDYSLTADFS